jgi:hypothetical protein
MKTFIAYFDYLGFKQFIDNNDSDYQRKIMGNIFRDMDRALRQGVGQEYDSASKADYSMSRINCINFSDTVVFWSNDNTEASLKEIIRVAYYFNWQSNIFRFPVRGSVVYGDVEYQGFERKNGNDAIFNINSVYGKGLVRAHEKANNQHWAGTVLDVSFTGELVKRGYNLNICLQRYAKLFKVPYKNGYIKHEEYVMCLIQGGLDRFSFQNYEKGIRENFANHNKSVDNNDVMEKLENTLRFLASFCNEAQTPATSSEL